MKLLSLSPQVKIFSSVLCYKTLSVYVLPLVSETDDSTNTRVYPKVSGLSRWRNTRLQQ